MRFKKGFTLVELLVAATIISILMAFATVQYRNSVAEARWTHAKAMADQLAAAVQRAKFDYPALSLSDAPLTNVEVGTTCSYQVGNEVAQAPSMLIACGYLENSDWNGDYFQYYIANEDGNCSCTGLACVKVKEDAKLPSAYANYSYCIEENLVTHESTSED